MSQPATETSDNRISGRFGWLRTASAPVLRFNFETAARALRLLDEAAVRHLEPGTSFRLTFNDVSIRLDELAAAVLDDGDARSRADELRRRNAAIRVEFERERAHLAERRAAEARARMRQYHRYQASRRVAFRNQLSTNPFESREI